MTIYMEMDYSWLGNFKERLLNTHTDIREGIFAKIWDSRDELLSNNSPKS